MDGKEKKPQEAVKEKTITREFEEYGRFKVRGIKAGERMKIQSECMNVNTRTNEMEVDAKTLGIKELQTCLLDSPEGEHPPTLYLEALPSGLVEDLAKDIKRLSSPDSKIIKN